MPANDSFAPRIRRGRESFDILLEDEIPAVLVNVSGEQRVYVPIRPICERLGLAWFSQLQRIKHDAILNEANAGVFLTSTPVIKFSNPQDMICLPLDMLNGWLFGVNANRARGGLGNSHPLSRLI